MDGISNMELKRIVPGKTKNTLTCLDCSSRSDAIWGGKNTVKCGDSDSGWFEIKCGPIELERKVEGVKIKILCPGRRPSWPSGGKWRKIFRLIALVIIFFQRDRNWDRRIEGRLPWVRKGIQWVRSPPKRGRPRLCRFMESHLRLISVSVSISESRSDSVEKNKHFPKVQKKWKENEFLLLQDDWVEKKGMTEARKIQLETESELSSKFKFGEFDFADPKRLEV